ncbi:ABC transporter ATP-binding protein [Bacillus sp. V3-13]|uniref:ABC transporter ATP-binding protein n=1 Tax=Bacillus sp. V3-13 TaxID=2053728 RepID=UPI000C76ACD2|nr:ABC transporter ATP-binding protein [Bacillus sp. V3-13]PLR77310.1 ABC transporter ATP-binding protein [Bacillus sp. V3-13]
MKTIVSLTNVTKTFKDKKAVDDVTFSINKGEVVAILGPNGAGKTTAISMMLGLLEPSSGKAELFGSNPRDKKVRERIGAMLQEVSVIDALKVREVISLFRSYYLHPLTQQELTELTGLSDQELNMRAEKLSGGQKRRLSFALALAGDPDLLFFDEPTVGMDTMSRKLFWNTVKLLKERGKTIIFTTHYLQEAEDAAERIILFHKGAIAADGTQAEIKERLTKQSVSFKAETKLSLEKLHQLPDVTNIYRQNARVFVVANNTDRVLAALFENDLKVRDIEIHRGRLDEAFEQLTEEMKEVNS